MNETKTNKIIDVKSIYNDFVKCVGNNVCKLNFSDAKSQPYCGYDDFSVNLKSKSYNVYMSTVNSDLCKTVDNTLEVLDNSKNDTTKKQLRCKLVKFTDYALSKECMKSVSDYKFGKTTATTETK